MSTSPTIGNIIVYVVCIGLTIAVAWQILDGRAVDTWHLFRDLPIWLQVILAIVLLPWLLALWVWQTGWALPVRLIVVLGLMVFVLYAFFPRGTTT
jgi:hypothetical protein